MINWNQSLPTSDLVPAASFLSLTFAPASISIIMNQFQNSEIVWHKATDILRASGLTILSEDDFHVAAVIGKMTQREAIAPVLLVRGPEANAHPLTIVYGYHRVCAAYFVDKNVAVPCILASLD
jgi:hypothetical protein